MLTDLKQAPSKSAIPVQDTAGGLQLTVLSLSGVERTELPSQDSDYSFERERALTKNTPEGLQPVPHDECKIEHKLSKELVKKFTANIMKGPISFPIFYSEPRSYIERTADLLSFLVTKYIPDVIQINSAEKDPYKMLALITTGLVASFHIDLNPKKVFNPYLGETLATRWPNGTQFFAEQSSHHPPVSDIQVLSPDNSYRCYAHANFDVENGMNQVEINQNGVFTLEITNGPTYTWEFPTVSASGFMKGDKTLKMKGAFTVTDQTNNLVCTIGIAPNVKKLNSIPYFAGMKQSFASNVYGGINKKPERKVAKLSIGAPTYEKVIYGDYCKEIFYDGDKIWDIQTDTAQRPIKDVEQDMLLPSDSRYRLDRVLLIKGQMEDADKAKSALEEIQRREEKIRFMLKKSKSIGKLSSRL